MSHNHALAMFEFLEKRSGYLTMRISKGMNMYFHGTFPLPRNMPWTTEFNRVLLRIVEAGIADHFVSR